jgi:hypothetical protein
MTQDEIIKMAKEAGMEIWKGGHRYMDDFDIYKFSNLVAQHEREECIKACEEVTAELKNYAPAFEGYTAETKFIRNIGQIVGEPFIDAIRARGQE